MRRKYPPVPRAGVEINRYFTLLDPPSMRKSSSHQKRTVRRGRVGLVKSNPQLQIGQGQYVPKLSRVSLRFSAQSEAKQPSIDLIRVSGNNVQDPLGTTGTGAPPGFNYWAAMYERYRVIGSKCEITCRISHETKDASLNNVSARVILLPCNNTTALASGSDYSSQPYAKSRSFTSAMPTRMSSVMKSATILGQKDVLGSDRLQSTVATAPNDEWFWRIITVTDNDISSIAFVAVTLAVTYDVEFFDRQPLDRPAVMKYFQAAYMQNCREILEKESLQRIQREHAQQRFEEKLLLVAEEPDAVLVPPLVSSSSVRNESLESKATLTPKPLKVALKTR